MNGFTMPVFPLPVQFGVPAAYQPIQSVVKEQKEDVKSTDKQVLDQNPIGMNDQSKNSQEEEKENIKDGKDKQIRWKKKNDVILFEELERYCRENQDTIEGIMSRIYDFGEIESFWGQVSKKVGWVGTFAALSRRFLSL